MAAQIERALAAGIAVTHIDTHMGTIAHPKFLHSYLGLARQHHLPAAIPRWDEERWRKRGYDRQTALQAVAVVTALEEEGVPAVRYRDRPAQGHARKTGWRRQGGDSAACRRA